MIKRVFYETREDGVNLYRTFSDEGYKIKQKQTGIIYDEAIDVDFAEYTYEETTEKVEIVEETAEAL